MKKIVTYINEVKADNASSKFINFGGQEFQLDHVIGANVHKDIDDARTVDTISTEMFKDLKKQGCKYVLCFPPHYYTSTGKNDVFIIKMFIKSKKMSDSYKHTQMYALYDTKTGECVNKDEIKAYKVIRFE